MINNSNQQITLNLFQTSAEFNYISWKNNREIGILIQSMRSTLILINSIFNPFRQESSKNFGEIEFVFILLFSNLWLELSILNCEYDRGGIKSIASVIDVQNSAFRNCLHNQGAAISAYQNSLINIVKAEFRENMASDLGGAIFFENSFLKLYHCRFLSN